jgi:hypothetical protein
MPSKRARVCFAVATALAAAFYCWLDARVIRPAEPYRDFDRGWLAARLLIQHQNPYQLIGPGRAYPWDWPFFYPITAAVAVLPLAWLPVFVARIAFAGLSVGSFAYVLTRDSWVRWPAVLSRSALIAALTGQWSPLLIAAASVPALGGLLATKPNLGLILLLGQRQRRAQWIGTIVGGSVLAVVSFVFMPNWLAVWLHAARGFGERPLIMLTPLAILVLLALFRWRRPEARLLILMAAVVRTPALYDELPLFVIPNSLRESFVLVIGSHLAALVQEFAIRGDSRNIALSASGLILFLYLPATIMILRRPNLAVDSILPSESS